ncbi:unnamed protein product [Fraxinus pennsylvanica]|uniref:Peptidase A1 domain-containing protein n=1 Tax=Fraxinus pennsylvanica TaxID=56036 RepID=A0AAD1ZLY4_9LAMI|nr:unnamed protein product [Fraxinus pennsylvanica]
MANSMDFIAFMIAISIISISKFPMTEAGTSSFSIDLIHRDSPQSPSYNSSLLPLQRSINGFRRSFNRLNRFMTDHFTQSTNIISDNGEYLMKFYVGTPPVPILAIFDTGSDLIWSQCQPCVKCFKQKYPIFNPRNSSTYRKLACRSSSCKAYPESTCGKKHKTCLYSQYYADGSFTIGTVVTETITLSATKGRNVSIPKAIIGCGVKNDGIFNAGESGIAGFGSGKVSLISQLGSSVQGRFSYCLVSGLKASNSSKLNIGENAVVRGKGAVSTPMVFKSGRTFYFLTLEGISLGNKRLNFYNPSIMANVTKASHEGNMIIDSGTTLTFLHTDLYNKLLKALKRTVKLRRVNDPLIIFDLCYYSKKHIKVPVITVHFKGADVKLNSENTFFEAKKNVYCLAFGPAVEVGLFGNLAQRNFQIGYDLIKKTISFKPTDCSKS